MGVIKDTPGRGPKRDEEGNYIFSSKPGTPGEKGGKILVKFQAVGSTHPCLAQEHITIHSHAKLSTVRRDINKYFKNKYEKGFIFLSKTKEILKSDEKTFRIFDILPKVPRIEKQSKPSEHFLFPDVHYEKIFHNYDGGRYSVTCACVVFLFERSAVSHWPKSNLRYELGADVLEGFSFIPTDIMSWPQRLVESRVTNVHIKAAQIPNPGLKGKKKEEYDKRTKEELERAIQQIPPRTKIHDLCDHRSATPLHYAASNGNLALCEVIIAGMGKDQLFSVDASRRTPLHCALYKSRKSLDTVIYLVQQSSNLSLCDIHGLSPLAMLQSLQTKHLNYISDKLEFDCASKELQVFFLQYALTKKKEKLALTLTEHLGDMSNIVTKGESFLHQSASLSVKITDKLLRHCHLNPVIADITGRLPFHVACKSGSAEQISLLYDNAVTDDQLRIGLKIALRYRKFEFCPHILSLRPELIMDEEIICTVRTMLNQLIEKYRRKSGLKLKDVEEKAKYLLPILSTEKNALGIYMFDCAYFGMHSTMEYLIDQGIDTNICDFMGRTPLHEASQQNHIKCVEILLKNNARINSVDQRRSSALHYACEKGHLNVVKCLIEHGASIDAQDVCGRTCFMLSIYRGRHDISNYLVKKRAHKLGLWKSDMSGLSTLSYSSLLPEESFETLLEEFANARKDKKAAEPPEEDEVSKRSENNQIEGQSWIWQMHDTSFRASFPDRMYDEEWSLGSEMTKSFNGTSKISLWREKKMESKTNAKPRTPSIQYDVCRLCQRIRFRSKHKCSRVESSRKIEESRQKAHFKPFEFHTLDKGTPLSPSHVALRDQKLGNLKKLSKFQPELLKSKDSLGRNLINFAVDQGSLKLVKGIHEIDKNSIKNGLVHDLLIRNIVSPELEDDAILEFILSLGYDAEFIPEPDSLKHLRCGYHLHVHHDCHLHCHLRSFTPLEVAIRSGKHDQFKLILSHLKSPNLGVGLHFVSFFGNSKLIDALHKARQKLRNKHHQDTWEEEDIQEWLKLDSLYALNLACCSPHIDIESMKSLMHYHPDAMKTENCMNINDLEEIRKYIKLDIDPSAIPQMTPLAKLLSPKHPNKSKAFVDDIGCQLIDSGLNLGIYKYDDGETNLKLHCACESLYAALLSGHYKSALNILRKAGNIIWRCALSDQRCSVQASFRKRMFHWQRTEYLNPSYIKYIMFLSSRREVPEIILKALITEGEHFIESSTDECFVDISEVRVENRDKAANLTNPIYKILVCVLEIMEVEKTKTGDFLKFLRYAPVVYPFICGVQERLLEKTDLTRKESMLFRSMARFMSLSELPDHDRPPGNTSLLHVACCTDKKDFVKMIAESPVTPDIMAKTSNKLRAIDIASSFGHWTVVQYLLEKSASFSCETLLACTAKENYMGIGIWARHLVYITESETASDKSRTKIFKELCKQKDLDLTYSTPENGSILFNAMQNQLNDIVDFIIEKNQTVLMKVLNEEAQITKYIPKCKSKTLASIAGIVERHLTKVKPQSLGKLLISLSSQKNNDELINLTAAMKRSVSFDIMQEILSETDEHGRMALHYTAIHGHKSACKALVKCTRSSKQQEIYGQIINREDSSRTPALWYAMANGHWEVANILLLAGASPVLIRSVPDFRPRRYFKIHNQKMKNGSALPENNKSSEYKIPMRKTFPLLVNSSFDVGPCINPGVKLFEERTDASTESPNDVQRQKTESSALKIIQTKTKVKHETQYLFDLALVASCHQTTIFHVLSNMGNAPLLSKAKEYFGTGQSHFDTGYKFSPFMHSVLSRNADAIEIVRADNSFKIENIEFWRAFIWTYSRNDVPCKFLEISLFSLLEMVLRKSEMTEEKQSLLNEITNDHARKRFAPILDESTFIDGHLRRVIRIMNEDKNYLLDEDQVQIFLDLHSYIRNGDGRQRGKTAKEQVTPISFHSDGQETGKVSSEYVKDLTTHLLIQNAEKLEKQIVFLLMFTGQQWCIDALLDAADQNKDIQTLLSSKLFGSFSFLDCLLTAMSKRMNRISLANVTERALTSLENTVDEDVVMFAAREQLWDALKPIAVITLAQQGELSFCWHRALASAALCGNIEFVQSLLNLMSLSRLSEPAKSRFGVHLCLASLTGKTDVVRLLLRAGAPIVLDTKSEEIKILMGKHYRDNWTVLHYAVKSNDVLTLEAVAKFCKFDKDFMSSLQYGSLFDVLSSSVGNTVTMTFLTRMFKEKGIQPSRADWEKYALEAAKNGFEELCSYIVETGSVDVMCVDSRNRNLLHYCALRDMDKLLGKLINNASAAANTKDLDGFSPYEYAFCLGNQNTANIFQVTSALEKGFRMPGSQHVYGWLRHLLETNGKSTGEDKRSMFHALAWNPAPDDNRKRCKLNTGYMDRFSWYFRYLMYRGPLLRSFDKKLSLENVIKRYDDHTTAFILILSTNSLREAMIERPKEYSHLFHLTAGYGHKKSLNILCELLKQNQGVLLKYLKMETNGIIPLANAVRNKHRDCIEILMQLDSCDDWKSSRTGENVLHFACKTGRIDIVQQLLKHENRNMLFLKDSNKSTPIMASLALGHHALLSELDLTEIDLKSDCKHEPENIDFSCETCLLNESIGWPDIYHRKIELPWKGLRSVGMSEENQLKKCSTLDRLFNKCGLQSPIVKAVMISMGYEPTAPNVLLRLALQPPGKQRMGNPMTLPAGKIMTCEEFSQIVEKLPTSEFDTFSMFSWSIQHDSDALFEKLSKGLSKLPSEFEKRTGISCYEAVLGLGSYKCFNILQKLLDIEQDEFRTFREIKDHLPVHLKWLARLDVPGDDDWCKSFDNHSISDTSERLSCADIWLISRFPSDIRNEMETIHGDRSWIPPTINGKKLSVDIESFKKHKNLSGKSLQWISCFIGSGSVAGTLHNATEQSLPKVQSANSIKVSCIQSGSNDHAKMVVDGSGCIQASIELLSDKGALFVIDDRSIHQKCVETELKDKIQHGVIPSFEEMIKANFNLDVTIKVDWQSIEIRKRNWNAEMVFKALTGEIFNNELGGFADVLGEAIEMRWDIEDMFNEETVKLAMGTALELKEITIAFDDKKPSTNGMLSQKTHILKDKCTWSFTIENNCLFYNRETFPLWRNLFFYRGMCTSLCSAVHSISVIQPQLPVESNHSSGKMKKEKTERNVNPTLEVEWKSFGLKDIYAVRSLVSNQIAREVQGISCDCAGMLRLCQESKRILVKNSPSHQHSGITFQNQTAVIAIYPSQNSKKEWQIERTNADTRLAEHEDRQLQSKWGSSHLKDIRQQIGDIEKHIEKETGLRVKIIIDEKRFLPTVFCKLRREMTDPYVLISKATEKVVDSIRDIYIRKIDNLVRFAYFVVCLKDKGFISTTGAWVRSRSSDAETGLLLQVHEYKKAYKAKKSKFDYTLLPWKLTHVDFKITSDIDEKVKSLPSTVTKEIGPWEVQSLVEAGKNAGFLTFKDRLYGVNDQREFAMYMSKLSSRVTIAQEVLDIFETKGNVSLESRICPIETSFNSKRAAALHMKYTLIERLLKLLPVNDINFDEESFLEDPNGLIQLSECGECAIDTIYKVFRPDTSPVCSVEIQRKNVLFHLLSKVKVLKFIQIRDTDDGTQNSNDRIVLCLQSKILSKIVLHRKRNITIVFSKFAVRETFIDEFESALIHLEEMVIEELLPCKFSNKPQSRTSSAVSSSVRRRFIDINHVARPKYETVLDLFFEICDVYKRLKETIPEISDIASHKVRNVCMSSVDGDKLRAGLVGDTLVIHVPPVCISTREFASMLLSSLGISDDMRNVEIPMFLLDSSRLFYPDKNSGEVELGFHNLVDAIDQNVNFHHTFEKDFTVRIMDKKGKINSSIEASIQNVEVTDDQHVKVFWSLNEKSLEHNCSIQVLYKMGEIDCATGLLLPNHLYAKKIRNVGEIKGDVHVDRGGWLPILLLHSNSPVGNKSEKITNPHRVQIVRKPCVEFSISAQAKSFPSPNIARNPVQIEQYHSGDSVMRYKIKILDSCRSVQLTAKCMCCEQQLSIATPDWYLEPGEKLRINPQEESH